MKNLKLTLTILSFCFITLNVWASECPWLLRRAAILNSKTGDVLRPNLAAVRNNISLGRAFDVPLGRGTNAEVLAVSPDGRTLYLGFVDTAHVYLDLLSGQVFEVPGSKLDASSRLEIKSAVFLSEGPNILVAHNGPYPEIRDAQGQQVLHQFSNRGAEAKANILRPSEVNPRSLALSPDEKWLLTPDQNGQVLVWDLNNLQLTRTLVGSPEQDTYLPLRARFSPGGEVAALVRNKLSSLEIYDVTSWQLARKLESDDSIYRRFKDAEVTSFTVGPGEVFVGLDSGKILRVAAREGKEGLGITGQLVNPAYSPLVAHNHALKHLVLSKSGDLLASVSLNGLSLWETASGKLVRSFYGSYDFLEHKVQTTIYSVAFSPDGSKLYVRYGESVQEILL